MLKRILIVCISILILLGNINVFAEEYIEEELKEEEFGGFLHETLAESPKVKTKNSRNAIIYDRATR